MRVLVARNECVRNMQRQKASFFHDPSMDITWQNDAGSYNLNLTA